MVGKSLRKHESKDDSSGDEFPSLDKSKKGNVSSQTAEDCNILDGFDVEGLTEREKEDLKKAIMESKNEVPSQHMELDEEKSSYMAPVVSEPECVSVIDEEVQVVGEQECVSVIDDEDDDETQPPEDMEEEFGFNLMEPTLVETDESTEEMISEDKTVSPVIDDKSVPNSNEMKDGRYKSFEPMDDKTELEDRTDNQTSACSPTSTTDNKQSQETESAHQTNSQTDGAGPIRWDGFPKFGEVPLHRHYRAVSTQTVKNAECYFTRGDTESESSVKAIYQLFELFRIKLKEAQLQCQEKLPWGQPVKPGSHQSRTIDIKKRGQDSFYLDLSQESDEDIEKVPKSIRGRPLKKSGSQSQDNSDDDLPDLIVEDVGSFKGRSLRKRKLHNGNKNIESNSKTSATQHISLDGENSDDEFQDVKHRNVGRTYFQTKKHDTHFVDNACETSDNKRPRKQRSNKKTDTCNKVLVEETQEEFGGIENTRQCKEDSEITVCETQNEDDNFDRLNVRKTAAGERFENPMHQAKLKNYTIRKVPHSKSRSKATNKTENLKESSDSLDSVGEKHQEIESVEVKENQQPFKRKKRKAKKSSNVLVEETQDMEADISDTNSGSKRIKRKCFKLGSSSEEESVANTQDMHDPPELEPDCAVDLNDNETGDKHCKQDESDTKAGLANLSENSQSPVIKKSKKSSVCVSEKEVTDSITLDEETELEINTNENFPCERKLRTLSGNRTNVRKGRMLKNSALDAFFTVKDNVAKGVKKLFNRPVSKESIDSNNSDDVSTTSSQRSGMIIDEEGDLYSTQFCEIKGRKRKKVDDSKANSSQTFDQKMKMFEDVLTPDKVHSSVPARRITKVSLTSSHNINNPNVEKNIKYLNKMVGVSSNAPIDLDSDSNGEEKEVKSGRSQSNQQRTYGNVFVKTTQTRKPIISLNDVATAKEVQQVKADINQTAGNVKPSQVFTPNVISENVGNNEDEEEDADSSPDIFSLETDEEEDPMVGYIKEPNIQKRVNKKSNVHWTETKVESNFVDQSKDVSERSETNRRMRDNEKLHHGRGRKRQHSEDNDEEQVTREIQTIDCPICVRPFPVNVIEAHAADCNGADVDEEETNKPSHDRTEDTVTHKQPTPSNHKHGRREISPDDIHIDLVKQSNIIGDEFNVLKQLSDTGQEGEAQTCWICERLIKTQFKLHLERCYEEAAKQQKEIEDKGFREVEREPEREEVSPARTTRGRLRQQYDDGDMSRQKVNTVRVTRIERNQREEGEIIPARTGRSVGRKKQERPQKATSMEDG